MNQSSVHTAVWQEGKYWVSRCLHTDVSSFGDTREEALSNLKEALELYFDGSEASNLVSVYV